MLRMLVVEDEPVSARLITHMLKGYGQCDLATTGEQALDLFIKAQNNATAYDVVFLDIMLPLLDGQKVLARMRDLEAERGLTVLQGAKIIMTTSSGDDQNILESHIAGCNAYLVKPLMRDKLSEVMRSLELIE